MLTYGEHFELMLAIDREISQREESKKKGIVPWRASDEKCLNRLKRAREEVMEFECEENGDGPLTFELAEDEVCSYCHGQDECCPNNCGLKLPT